MRRGEILGLQWEHVNFLARTIFIARSKTGRTRTIPMNDIIFKELMMLKQDAGPKEFVFSNAQTGVKHRFHQDWLAECLREGGTRESKVSRHAAYLRDEAEGQWSSRVGYSRSTRSRIGTDDECLYASDAGESV
jgi:integrase